MKRYGIVGVDKKGGMFLLGEHKTKEEAKKAIPHVHLLVKLTDKNITHYVVMPFFYCVTREEIQKIHRGIDD